jgi:hypothetical protein
MGMAGGIGVVVALAFGAILITFMSLGGVLLAHFWLRHLSVSLRALVATGVAAIVLVLPALILSGDATFGPLMAAIVVFSIIGFPVAFLATRKLDRHERDRAGISSVFE